MQRPAPRLPERRYGAFLFDMDGTVLNSLAAAERIWSAWARRHGIEDVKAFLHTIHGARAVDTVAKQGLPGVDAQAEGALITRAEIDDVEGIVEIPGATVFLRSLPAARWAIVTSAPSELAARRMQAAGIPQPPTLVTAGDVLAGKPDPACYLLAARRLGVDIRDCLIFEDAPIGILAAERSGADVVVVTTTHAHPIATTHPTIVGYEDLAAAPDDDGLLRLERRAA